MAEEQKNSSAETVDAAASAAHTVKGAMPVHCFIFVDYGMRRILVLQTLKRSGGKSAVSHPEASSGLEA